MAIRLADTKPNPRATSHEGAHLFQHSRPNVFIVSWEAKGWYWSSLECDGGPYTCSVYAYLAAREYWLTMGPYSYNKRWVPSLLGEVDIHFDYVVLWYKDLWPIDGVLSAGKSLCHRPLP